MDLRPYLTRLESLNEVQRVEGADWDLEIGALSELSNERNGPALLFDKIKDYPPGYRVVSNLIATPRRLAITLGYPPDIPNVELVRGIKDKFNNLEPMPPTMVSGGPVLENAMRDDEVDLLKFPTPKWHEHDGGRYIGTADMVIMRDPKDNWVNAGTYRIQLHDKDTLALYISPGHHGRIIREMYWAQGKSCPVAMVFGGHPLPWMPCFVTFPWGTGEFGVAGALLGEPLQLVRGEYTGLPFPAHAEIVVEGEAPPPHIESRKEGPFGEGNGYYGSAERIEPVVKVKRVFFRNDPVLCGAPPMRPPASGTPTFVLRASNLWYELEKLGIPGIKGVWATRSGGSRFINVIAIEQKYAGHAMQVGMAAMCGAEGAYHGRFIIVVDDDVDPSNDEDVLWALATRCDPATSIQIVRQCWSTPLDPTIPPEKKARGEFTNSRAIMLAVRPFHWRNEFPRVNRASNELREKTLRKWKHLFNPSPPLKN
ncbi:MAG: UbiD family decarboxylase [Chloroflexi bacterium]|nr:UbiD family decarboxylase [Chloroflexota bacterium]